MESASPPILEVNDLVMSFGGLTALMNMNFSVVRGTIKAVIGPNGAGKTTLFNIISGALAPSEGKVLLNGRTLTGLKAHQVAARGVSRTFQTVELFKGMTVLENVMLGCHLRSCSGFLGCGLRLPAIRRGEARLRAGAQEILGFIGLADKGDAMAESLPLGDQKLLEIGRALAARPQLLCLDEPAAGLNETESEAAANLIRQIKAQGITVLLVEHDMQVIMSISDEIMVLNYGQKIAEGTPDRIKADPKVIEAYLGEQGY